MLTIISWYLAPGPIRPYHHIVVLISSQPSPSIIGNLVVSVTLCLRGPGHTSVPEIRRTLAVSSISYEEAMNQIY